MYRADHVGSFLRPRPLYEAYKNPQLSPAQRTEIENQSILDVLQRQKNLGFKIFTDGELRRRGFMTDFYDSVEGLDMDGSVARAWHGGQSTAVLTGIVVEKIRQTRRLAKHEVDFLKLHSP